jgi:hypothetical protein
MKTLFFTPDSGIILSYKTGVLQDRLLEERLKENFDRLSFDLFV